MKFKPLITKKKNKELKDYLKRYNLNDIFKKQNFKVRKINQMEDDKSFQPELDELFLLHNYIIKYKRMTILEFGNGWSTLVMANALAYNKKKYLNQTKKLRMNNAGELHSIDNNKSWIKKTKNKLKNLKQIVKFHFSDVLMDDFNGRICTSFKNLPTISPDFIYLDGPDQFNVKGNINGINIGHNDFMPMVSDLLKIEHFLKPGTIIVVDGRAANSRFLRSNFQRKWFYSYNSINDQHIFFLEEKPLGNLNKQQLNFYFK